MDNTTQEPLVNNLQTDSNNLENTNNPIENSEAKNDSANQIVDNSGTINPVVTNAQIQQDNNKPLTGFQLHPENINRNGAPRSEEKKAREKIQQTIEKILDEVITTQDGKVMTKQVAMIRQLINRAIKKDNAAATIIMDRLEGKPTQPVDISGEVNLNVNAMLTKIYGDTESGSTT